MKTWKPLGKREPLNYNIQRSYITNRYPKKYYNFKLRLYLKHLVIPGNNRSFYRITNYSQYPQHYLYLYHSIIIIHTLIFTLPFLILGGLIIKGQEVHQESKIWGGGKGSLPNPSDNANRQIDVLDVWELKRSLLMLCCDGMYTFSNYREQRLTLSKEGGWVKT